MKLKEKPKLKLILNGRIMCNKTCNNVPPLVKKTTFSLPWPYRMQEQVNFEIPAYLKANGQFNQNNASLFTFTQVVGTNKQRQKQWLWKKNLMLTIMVKSVSRKHISNLHVCFRSRFSLNLQRRRYSPIWLAIFSSNRLVVLLCEVNTPRYVQYVCWITKVYTL